MDRTNEKKRLPSFWTLQLGGWGIYLCATVAVLVPEHHGQIYLVYRILFFLSMFVMSFVMHALCHQLWNRRIDLIRALWACLAAAAFLGIVCSAVSLWGEARFGRTKVPFEWIIAFEGSVGCSFVLLAWAALYLGIKHYGALEEQHIRLLNTETLAREAQLQALRYQLQPHFLFNTLNAISTLILDQRTGVATKMIARLADLLRLTLESPEKNIVSLSEELASLEEYLAIEEMRFGPKLVVCMHVTTEVLSAQVPRFMLQPILENAIRHGISRRAQGGCITIRAGLEERYVSILVENEGTSSNDGTPDGRLGSAGLGLANTRARLRQMYGVEAQLEAIVLPDGGFKVAIRTPFLQTELGSVPSEVEQ